ncbi:MAG: hypothetical protein ABL995_04525 [Bryobacteraceae bacterium]
MEYLVILGLGTAAIVLLAAALYRIRRDAGIIAGIGALYYWSLYGAWSIVVDKMGGFSGKHYYYLERKLFPIVLDSSYLETLILYTVFIVLVEAVLWMSISGRKPRSMPRIALRHEPILAIGILAGVASYLIIRDKLAAAWALNTSAYWYTRSQTDEWFTAHQVLNRVALIPPAIGLATLAAGRRSKYFVNVVRRYTWLGYVVLMGGMLTFTFILGNKNEVFTALVTGVLAYAASVGRVNWLKVGLVAIAGLWLLYGIDFFRATPLSSMASAVTERAEEATEVGRFVTSSNETFAAHFSMYGVLANNVEPKFGYSFYSLVCSIIPRVLWKDRPRDIYLYYSESVGAIQNQGYSLHHATGWFLNFGYAGIALGAGVMGLVWAWCLNLPSRIRKRSGLFLRLFAIIGPWVFVAGLPPLLRAGPEGYKGFLVEGVAVPLLVFAIACKAQRKRKAALTWDPRSGWVFARPRRSFASA